MKNSTDSPLKMKCALKCSVRQICGEFESVAALFVNVDNGMCCAVHP
jgi:hypothetical protein